MKKIYRSCIWDLKETDWKEAGEKKIYLTFDDGPHPVITPKVLDILASYNAKATFFCIGKNVQSNPDVYERILEEGHRVGNHTMNHLNGWKTKDNTYLANIQEARQYIDSNLFRPPYGKIGAFQMKQLREQMGMKIVMWTVLSGDFDLTISARTCTENVLIHAREGSIIVFHDSEKALPRMLPALESTLAHFAALGYEFAGLPLQ